MKHVTESELTLHYYHEDDDRTSVNAHLRQCPVCTRAYQELADGLDRITPAEAPEPGEPFWAALRRETWITQRRAGRFLSPRAPVALLVWLVPLSYPLVPSALFYSAQVMHAQSRVGAPMLVAALAWAMIGPLAAVMALNRLQGARMDRAWHRLVVYGAVAATVGPALFNLTSRTGMRFQAWYLAIAILAATAAVPISALGRQPGRLRVLHRRSAMIIAVFALVHLANHLVAIVSVPAHSAVLGLARELYRRPVVESILFAAIVFQVATGAALVWRVLVRRPSTASHVQAMSGLYVAVFFLAHVSAALLARGTTDTNFVWAAGQNGVLARQGSTFLLPYYLLGIAALFAHVGQYLRLRLVGLVPEVSLQRLSYAAMAFASMIVVTIGLALCGVSVAP